MKLYEITQEYNEAIELYNNALTQEELDQVEGKLNSIVGSFESKAKGITHIILNARSDAESLKVEIERLADKLVKIQKVQEWLKNYLSVNMLNSNIHKLEFSIATLSFRKSRRVEIINEDKVPENYIRTRIVKSVDKDAVKKSWDQGIGVEGTIVQECDNLQIK